jgi:purine-binding chemotaxis protein CheW
MQSERTFVVVDICGKACGLPLEDVQELVPMAWLSRPPGIPSLIGGFLNLRGMAVPVLPVGRLFGLQERPLELHTPLVIVRSAGYSIALLVDNVSRILSVSSDALVPLGEDHVFNNCAEAETVVEGRVIHVLSLKCLLIEKERRILSEFQAIEQQRLQHLDGQPA